jgi:hypothetical protein
MPAVLRSRRTVAHLTRHYVEMVVVMLLGMAVLWVPARMGLDAAGVSSQELHTDLPAVMLLGMAASMTLPMVAWMRFRGHGWAACADMTLAMVVPALATVGLLAVDAVVDMGALMTIEHAAMFSAMALAMVLRPAGYLHAA